MNAYLLALTGVVYGWVAINELMNGNPPVCLVFIGYIISTIGYIWMTK